MYIKKVTGYVVPYITKGLFDRFEPVTQESKNWKQWVTHMGPFTCPIVFLKMGLFCLLMKIQAFLYTRIVIVK